ncbi:disulfide bond formation protein B [Pseudohoeflea coraliihabitans]|uniref:Disulfide bond formation protein B n=1 Tax=Pseudohoeflea coraliihabitans TaxID=2860393 RepID=A0ABS6WKM1_9HYPH|nr:disulfide bond formation protein B [Pseudohoeflea sp. DP4N28-3]MBW3096501.1 disulfide bond formation protein B [Pseudohoeflea sp. DP4N28-3]
MHLATSLTAPTGRPQLVAALFLTLGMAAVVGTALAFEHIGGYIPCALCLTQRTPYYLGIPLMALAALSQVLSGPALLTRGLLLAGALLMLYGGALGIYHSGVEWQFWPGPTSCATSAQGVTTNAGDLLSDLNAKKPPSCDAAALRVLGLSFAGWNVIASAILAIIALRAAFRRA